MLVESETGVKSCPLLLHSCDFGTGDQKLVGDLKVGHTS
jgi:hypothetical protein